MKTKGLKIAALVPPAFMVLVLLAFGIGESLGGDLSGLMHLAQAAPVLLVIWLGWKRPLWGGILLLLGAAFKALTFWRQFPGADSPAMISPSVIMILPLALSGVLLLVSARLAKVKPSGEK